jgi:bifunctional non-homologous end joining protein LigD
MAADETRDGVSLTHLDVELFDGAGVTKRDLVDYLDAVRDRLLPVLRDRPLSVIRARPGQPPFMQKNLPQYAPEWIRTVSMWAERSRREVAYPICDDRRTLLWLANQRAVEYHPALWRGKDITHLILDLDPPEGSTSFAQAVAAAALVRQALASSGLEGAVKTSGAKGVHIFVPLVPGLDMADIAAATRALAARAEALDPDLATTAYVVAERGGKVFLDATRAGGATVAAVYSPRARPGVPVSFPVAWSDLDRVAPGDFTVRTVPELLGSADPWAEAMPAPQSLPDDLVAQGHTIPIARVQAMHEGKRRARAREQGQ